MVVHNVHEQYEELENDCHKLHLPVSKGLEVLVQKQVNHAAEQIRVDHRERSL